MARESEACVPTLAARRSESTTDSQETATSGHEWKQLCSSACGASKRCLGVGLRVRSHIKWPSIEVTFDVDEFTRQCLRLSVGRRFTSLDVIDERVSCEGLIVGWCRGEFQRQGETHHEKGLRLSHSRSAANRHVSRIWETTGAKIYPQILVTSCFHSVPRAATYGATLRYPSFPAQSPPAT